jgi:hypothetical protein
MRRRKPARVMGPYKERNRWRVVVVENGRRQAIFLPTQEEAERLKTKTEKTLATVASRKLGDVLAEWTAEKFQTRGGEVLDGDAVYSSAHATFWRVSGA